MPTPDASETATGLLGPADIRRLAAALDLRPSKSRGQNFVHDAGTVRRIVRLAGVQPGETILEVGPGLGSLTLALLQAGARVIAVEVEPALARALPITVSERLPGAAERLAVLAADALTITGPEMLPAPDAAAPPTRLVANLPYNVAVPVLLTVLAALPSLRTATIMVQAEVADRLTAAPGSRTYGVPSVKAAWYGDVHRDARIGRSVFWPVPNVDSAIVTLTRREPPVTTATREQVFAVVDAAFAQRRKTLRKALAPLAGGTGKVDAAARAAGIDPSLRGEKLDVCAFAALAQALVEVGALTTAPAADAVAPAAAAQPSNTGRKP
ncbi:16S rRNA (adenine(1518)-N(6)/adenine(1519)-N(6))-dimethyltransferase RsmA [Actinomyces ruminicola]|uniref:Ribosomal RNA small subunit methyltransferase A n=1 Tax=Actinomyces ruminicola TaxID=332524 RepID=A0A1G9ZQC2_9ACTO|nr:16S rRNA (adenine(1518)-N(6)/adenine(1519)-N(6))-dimethyltransferase RsmA [Actinomyces ruminicola]SDN23287.1 16S rRNA (adenine1518-N6/adenine1519-N6)-dimethyltransferase [Actinomyces ruminicola]